MIDAALTPRRRLLLVLILGALSAFAPLATDMYLPAMPMLARVFATGAAQVQWTLATFFLGFASGQAFYGPVVDRYGRKPSVYFGLCLFIGASLGCVVAPTIALLAMLRFVQAVGACAGVVVARAVVTDLFRGQEAARIYAALMAVMGVAPMLAPLVGSYLLLWFGWQAIFWVLAGFGAFCLAAVRLGLPETHRADTAHGLAPGRVMSSYLRLLRDRHFAGYALSGAMSMAGMFAYIAGSPVVFINLHRFGPQHYAWLFGANALGITLASRLNHRLLHRTSADALLVWANAVQVAAGSTLLVGTLALPQSDAAIALPLFLYVACVGIVMPNSVALAMAPQRAMAGSASALIGVVQFLLASAAAALVGAGGSASALPMAALILLCGVLGLALRHWLVPHASA
jgi:MFS transporter, DHA1 family, multidrug resistance protein